MLTKLLTCRLLSYETWSYCLANRKKNKVYIILRKILRKHTSLAYYQLSHLALEREVVFFPKHVKKHYRHWYTDCQISANDKMKTRNTILKLEFCHYRWRPRTFDLFLYCNKIRKERARYGFDQNMPGQNK